MLGGRRGKKPPPLAPHAGYAPTLEMLEIHGSHGSQAEGATQSCAVS